jgi:hypothetical protein
MSNEVQACVKGILAKLTQHHVDVTLADMGKYTQSLLRTAQNTYVTVRVENVAVIYFFDESLMPGVMREVNKHTNLDQEKNRPYILWVYTKTAPPSPDMRKRLPPKK